MVDRFEDDFESAQDDETAECPNCGEQIYDDAEQCPYCLEYVTWNRSASFPAYIKVVVWVLILALLLPAILALVQLL